MAKLPFLFGNNKTFPSSHVRKSGILFLFAFLTIHCALAQNIEIRGRILEEGSKTSVIGATIRLKGQKGGTVSDTKGDFGLSVKTLPRKEVIVRIQTNLLTC